MLIAVVLYGFWEVININYLICTNVKKSSISLHNVDNNLVELKSVVKEEIKKGSDN